MTIDQVADYARQMDFTLQQTESATDALTQRERQVLVLLARGYTNRRIAAALTISSRTADGHVAHILEKLGLVTRAQAAVWAVEHQLAQPTNREPARQEMPMPADSASATLPTVTARARA
jgi:non-specific serine/threonine protein kinase